MRRLLTIIVVSAASPIALFGDGLASLCSAWLSYRIAPPSARRRARRHARAAPSRGCAAPARRSGRAAPTPAVSGSFGADRDQRHPGVDYTHPVRKERRELLRRERVEHVVERQQRARAGPSAASARTAAACAPRAGSGGSASSRRRAARRGRARARTARCAVAAAGDVLDDRVREPEVERAVREGQVAAVGAHRAHLRERRREPVELGPADPGDLLRPRVERLEEVVRRAGAERRVGDARRRPRSSPGRAAGARGTAGASAPGSAWTRARRPGAASADRTSRLGGMPIRAELRPKGPYSLRVSGRLASRRDARRRSTAPTASRSASTDASSASQAIQRADGTIVVAADSDAGVDHVRFALGLDDDHSEFVRRFANDPLLGETLRRVRGLRPMRTATVAQALLRAVAGQLILASEARRSSGASSRRRRPRSATCTLLRRAPSSARSRRRSSRASGSAPAAPRRSSGSAAPSTSSGLKEQPEHGGRAAAEPRARPRAVVGRRRSASRGSAATSTASRAISGWPSSPSALWGRWVEAEESDALLAPYGEWAGLASVYLLAGFQPRSRTLARCPLAA